MWAFTSGYKPFRFVRKLFPGIRRVYVPFFEQTVFQQPVSLEDDPGRMDGTNIEVSTGGGRIRTGHRIEYLLREFDGEGRLTRTITRDVPNLVPTLSYRGTGWNFGEFLAPLLLQSGHSLAPRFWAKDIESPERFVAELDRRRAEGIRGDYPEFEAAFDLLDPQGRYLGSIEAPAHFEDTGVPALVGPDGRLYTRVFEPFPQVRRFRVEIDH